MSRVLLPKLVKSIKELTLLGSEFFVVFLRKSWQKRGCRKIALEGWREKCCAEEVHWKYWNAAERLVLLFPRALPVFSWDAGRPQVEARRGTESGERTAGGSSGEEARMPHLLFFNSPEQSMAEGWTQILLPFRLLPSLLPAWTGQYQLSG